MAASDNLNSSQFIHVYRGRAHFWDWKRPKSEKDLHGLGMHWTTDPKVAAHHGAGWNDPEDDYWSEESGDPNRTPLRMGGHILEGRVAKEHVIQPHTEEWHKMASQHGIMDPNFSDHEKEVTIRPGAPVEVTGLHKVGSIKRERWDLAKTKTRRVSSFQGGMGTA